MPLAVAAARSVTIAEPLWTMSRHLSAMSNIAESMGVPWEAHSTSQAANAAVSVARRRSPRAPKRSRAACVRKKRSSKKPMTGAPRTTGNQS